ncbi:hypothetical protein D3C72_1857650 [compost metagenome]
MARRNLRHQRQPDAAATLGGAGHAVETVEHALAFGDGNAGSVVRHGQVGAALRQGAAADLHAAACRRVAQGVVQQVAHQHPQRVDIAQEGGGVGVQDDALLLGGGQHFAVARNHFHQVIQRHGLDLAFALRLHARLFQQLFSQPRRAQRHVAQLFHRLATRLLAVAAQRQVGIGA